ncbi:MAG TPA: hypothetical protein VK141_01075 [Nitrosomonas sp.]|nr:hypothetical protein [Nitrosomonas sp.]
MKKLFILLLSLAITGPNALLSQEIYVKLGGARRIGVPSKQIGINYTSVYTEQIANFGQEGVFGSFGAGNEIDCAIGLAGKSLGVEIGFSRVFKSTIDAKLNRTILLQPAGPVSENATHTYESSIYSISPCVVLTFPLGFTARIGGVLGFPTYTRKSHLERHSSSDYTYDWAEGFSGPIALGVSGSVGYVFSVATGLKLYVEADAVSLSWAPTSAEVTAYKMNGEDQLSTLPQWLRKTIYVESGPRVDTDVINGDEPTRSLKGYYSYSTVGLKAGVMIGL